MWIVVVGVFADGAVVVFGVVRDGGGGTAMVGVVVDSVVVDSVVVVDSGAVAGPGLVGVVEPFVETGVPAAAVAPSAALTGATNPAVVSPPPARAERTAHHTR
jgi:hypothetical protein